MNEQCERKGPNMSLLLLIPVAVMLMKGARRNRATMGAGWAPGSGPARRRHGHHAPFWGGGTEADGPGAFPLPPRIERMLGAWHTRAHQAAEPSEGTTA